MLERQLRQVVVRERRGAGDPLDEDQLLVGLPVETTPAGRQVATVAGDSKAGAGSLFGLAIGGDGKSIVYVDDALNVLRLLH